VEKKIMPALFYQKHEKGLMMKFLKKYLRELGVYEAYGITIAPSSEIARPVAPFPLISGTKRPLTTSEEFGLEYPSSTKKHVAIKNTRNAIRNSNLRTCTKEINV
jgi:hypothetical protein